MTPEFTNLNPNNKIPVLVDDGFVLTESGAILIYLTQKTGRLMPTEPKAYAKLLEAIMFQMASLGPMFGQLLVFAGAWKNEFPKVTDRYVKEVNRILGVLETRLDGREYFVGKQFTVADIAVLPWLRAAFTLPIGQMLKIEDKPNLRAWWDRVSVRPAVIKGLSIPPSPLRPASRPKALPRRPWASAICTTEQTGKPLLPDTEPTIGKGHGKQDCSRSAVPALAGEEHPWR